MKKMWKKSNKFAVTPVILAIWWMALFYLYPLDVYKIIQRRANYFIIRVPITDKIRTGSRGNLHLPDENTPVGTFKVADMKDNECLCVIVTIRPGIDSSLISRVSFTTGPGKHESINKSLSPLIITGLRFIPLNRNGKYYLSESPLPLKSIVSLNIAGIKNLLYKIEKENHRISADLIKYAQIRSLGLDAIIDFSDKKRIFLGTVEGKLSMIYEERGVLQFTQISPYTLKKFKNDIFFHVMLEKKEK